MEVGINQAATELWDALRSVNVSATIGHKKNVLIVFVDVLAEDASRVPDEFHGFKTSVRQEPKPGPPFTHEKVDGGCVHTRWEEMQYQSKGIVPNPTCELTQRTY